MFHRYWIVHLISYCLGFVVTLAASAALPNSSDTDSTTKHPIILIFSFDGFRYDYLDRGLNPFLKNITKKGVSTDYLANIFPTKTFTNHYSIATGMYAETHGVLGNKVFNENGKCLKYGYELYHYNEDILPMWTLNEMSGDGRHSGCLMWSGCEYPFKNVSVTHLLKYNLSIPWSERLDTIMSWLLDREKPMNLLNAYFEHPDELAHIYGPNSKEMNEKLKVVDDFLISFFGRLDEYPKIRDRINLIILSDHGMVELKPKEMTYISDLMDADKYTKCGGSTIAQVLPKPGFEEEIYKNLTTITNVTKAYAVFKNDQQPDSWHFRNNRRNIGLLVVADVYHLADHDTDKGSHGFVPEVKDMRAFFTAIGPIFKEHYHTPQLHNLDVYPLIAHALKLQSPAEHVKPNGTLAQIVHILK